MLLSDVVSHHTRKYSGLLAITLLLVAQPTYATTEDLRCKCTCLEYQKYNYSAQIYTGTVDREKCSCLGFVITHFHGRIPEYDLESYCLRCECKYEVRSTKTMQVVVYIFIALIATLVLYMIFMLIADPIMNKINASNTTHQPLHDNNTEMSTISRTSQTSLSTMDRKSSTSVFQRVNLVQSKWKKQVEEQRSSVFVRQEMLQ